MKYKLEITNFNNIEHKMFILTEADGTVKFVPIDSANVDYQRIKKHYDELPKKKKPFKWDFE